MGWGVGNNVRLWGGVGGDAAYENMGNTECSNGIFLELLN